MDVTNGVLLVEALAKKTAHQQSTTYIEEVWVKVMDGRKLRDEALTRKAVHQEVLQNTDLEQEDTGAPRR